MPNPIARLLVPATAVIAALATAGCATGPGSLIPFEADEATIARDEVPAAARASLEALAAPHTIIAWERENRGSFIAYEGEWVVDGIEQEASVMADGTVLETERELSPAEIAVLPPGVMARVEELRAQGYDVEVARREIILYDIDATNPAARPAEREILLRPDGIIIKE